MEFSNLDIRTNRSHLTKYFALRYSSFDDMSDFIGKVTMDGMFEDAEIFTEDIAYFAPELKSSDRSIKITGRVRGTVNNLHGKNIQLTSTKNTNTFLPGGLTMSGLPDIDNTYIDFNAKDFRTTYTDVTRIVPALKNITMPRIDRIEWLRFKGNFTGFLKDFVTYGTIQTNLGTITSDINMKLRGKAHLFRKHQYQRVVESSLVMNNSAILVFREKCRNRFRTQITECYPGWKCSGN
jgi:hypothetical protein